MKLASTDLSRVIAVTPQHRMAPHIAVGACRAGALGLLDIGVWKQDREQDGEQGDRAQDRDPRRALSELMAACGTAANWGLRCDLFEAEGAMLAVVADNIGLDAPVPVLLLAGIRADQLEPACRMARGLAHTVYLEVRDVAEALAAQRAGYDGLILKGHEAGGRVSRCSAFILAQEMAGKLSIPYWIQGGISVYSAAAAILSGASGVVLCEQLWMAAEAPPASGNANWAQLDGSETVLAGDAAAPYRCFSRCGRAKLRALDLALAQGADWKTLLLASLRDADDGVLAAGQDIAFAAPLAKRYGTTGRIVSAILDNIEHGLARAAAQLPLAPGAPLALAHGTRFPIAQGPMTRVSDVAPFAKAVAAEGALPFVALAVLRGPEVRTLLSATRELMGDMPWGVGVLGFMPLELRQEQLAVLREIRPPFAIIAGGRPSQARELTELGIATYLHVPSPGLLGGFLDAGARRFVFEGSECGGHTGPRSSFVLWQQAVEILANAELKDPAAVQVLFAGGIHDALSAAMVAVLAAPLVARGMKIGVLMGTAYLFTDEIVASGAIVEEFQRQAVACQETALLQSGVGIYTRCADTAFCAEFETLRRQLVLESKSEEETLMALELMNIGRLRIASKGITRNSDPAPAPEARYVALDPQVQRREGLYMLGDVARLRHGRCTLAELHGAVSGAAMELLQAQLLRSPLPAPAAAREEIAIVGMACHFPRAQGLREYWQNIMRGVDAIREVSDERWPAEQLFDPKRGAADKVYSKWGGFLDDIAFDPQRYGIAPASLSSIEPAQLLTLEVARLALADAGFDRRPFARERTACIIAVGGMNDLGTIYNFRTLLPQYLAKVDGLPEAMRRQIVDTLFEQELPKWTPDTFPGILGNVVAGRIANRLDLGGSNFTVDAACAASLAALEAGVRQLRDGDADVALVGGVDCTNSPIGFMCFAQTHALSPRGRSRPFDASADGIAISEGVGVLVLKRLRDAERDGDRIYALIKGIGSASDGRARSLTAPHPPGQVQALQRAYADAGVAPASVSLIEAHGTGTALGDKSELESLSLVLGKAVTPACALGSVKSMIGHTKVAAGMAGLIKAVLALQHRVLPPSLGVERPVAALQAAGSPLYLNSEARPWLHQGRAHPRYCGVSAFGFGGTNFHTVLAEYTGAYRPADAVSLQPREVELFTFAGATRAELEVVVKQLLRAVELAPQIDLAQLAYSLYREQHVIRRANGGQPCRLALGAASVADLREKLQRALALLDERAESRQAPGLYYRESVAAVGGVCFLFPGQGAQRVNMLRDLVLNMPALHRCFAQPGEADGAGPHIADLIYPRPVFSDAERERQQQALNATEIAQPALGMVNLAAFEVLTSYGLQPEFLAGHSYGEYSALCAAGVFSREDLLRLSLLRGRLSALAPPGAMAALDVDGARAQEAIARHGLALSVANLNAPGQTIVAGASAALEAALAPLAQDGIRVKRLAVGTAFHCAHMAPVRDALAVQLSAVTFHAPRVPVYCNLSAEAYPADGEAARALLARHIAEPVRFVEQIEALYRNGARVFIECGPGLTLTGLAGRILGQRPHTLLALDAPGRDGWVQLAQLLTQAMAAGLALNLAPWFAGRGLSEIGVNDLVEQTVQRSRHGPLIWRVNGGRALPWAAGAAPPAPRSPAPARPAPDAGPVPPAASRAPGATLDKPLDPPKTHHRRSTMSTVEFVPDGPPPRAASRAGPAPEMAQIQDGLARLLDFQSEQQRSVRHYLDIQAQLAGMALAAPLPAPGFERQAAPPPAMPAPLMVAASAPAMPAQPAALTVAAPAAPALPGKPARAPLLPPLPGPGPQQAGPARVPDSAAPPSGPIQLSGPAPASAASFKDELLRAVSERTGYPVEMLDMDAHMEADLGIDSIKRIEIFSGLTQRHSLVGERDEEKMIEDLAGFKTLNQVVAWYEQLLLPQEADLAGGTLPKKAPTPLSPLDEEVESNARHAQQDPVLSYVVQASRASLDGAVLPGAWPVRHPVLLAGQPSALATALREALQAEGHLVRQLVPGLFTRMLDDWRYEVDLSSLESLEPLLALFPPGQPGAGALINLMGWADQSALPCDHRHDARALFMLLKLFGPDLKRSAAEGAGLLVNLTAFDGRFGLGGPSALAAGSAGTLGVAKSAAREWAALRVKCIDAAPGLEPGWVAAQVLREIASADPEIEVGYSEQGRYRIDLAPRVIERAALSDLPLGPDAVVLVTGGAYGITADITGMLAEKYRPHLVLVGRSALPGDEAAATRALHDAAGLRAMLVAQARAGGKKVTPVQLDAELKRILKERQIRANLAAMRAAGCELEYHCMDVRDGAAFGALIDDVYARLGRIDGVLHGAGVISDKLIASKPLAAFDAVFDTKVLPALVMAQKLRKPGLRFLAFFSSVAGRFGNIGQADYSAANEVLNKLAGQLSHSWPHLHAVAINWGPWDAGMVSDDLRQLYAARAIRPIPRAAGRRHFLDELEHGPQGQAEVVISSSIQQIAALQLGR